MSTRPKLYPAERDDRSHITNLIECRNDLPGGGTRVRTWSRDPKDGKPLATPWVIECPEPRKLGLTDLSPIDEFNARFGVTELLQRFYGMYCVPGKSVRCQWHDDRHPSPLDMTGDAWVLCYSPSC